MEVAKMQRMQRIIQRLIDNSLATADRVVGCSEEEIRQIESTFLIKLPAAYREFLQTIGKEAGHFLVGTDAFFPTLLHLREWADGLLNETQSKFRLPSTAFVFLVHQGYQFMFFDTKSADDPEIFHFVEGDREPRK